MGDLSVQAEMRGDEKALESRSIRNAEKLATMLEDYLKQRFGYKAPGSYFRLASLLGVSSAEEVRPLPSRYASKLRFLAQRYSCNREDRLPSAAEGTWHASHVFLCEQCG